MITHSARSLGDETAVPVIWIQAIADLDVFDAIVGVIEEAAVSDNCVLAARDDGKLRWDLGAIPVSHFLDESDGLLTFGENAQREPHEIGIGEQLRHGIHILFTEGPQD